MGSLSPVFVFAGIMQPSLTSAVYFFIFLFLCTWWSLCRTFNTLLFSCMCVLIAIFSAGHIIVIYLYQFQFFQESIPPGDNYTRSETWSSTKITSVKYTLATFKCRCCRYNCRINSIGTLTAALHTDGEESDLSNKIQTVSQTTVS